MKYNERYPHRAAFTRWEWIKWRWLYFKFKNNIR